MKKRLTVGIFDSGIGGLTVLRECVRRAPYAKFYYLGDNGRAPYGSRSEEEILSFTAEAFSVFREKKVDAAVIACNTATAVAADAVRRKCPFPVLGVEPAIKPAAEQCKNVLVLSTERTAESARMKMLVGRFPDCEFQVFACRNLAGAIENYYLKEEPFLLSAHLPQGRFDGVVLGCTHYSFFKEAISKFYACPVFDGGEGVAKRLCKVLETICLGKTAHLMTTQNIGDRFSFSAKKSVKFIGKYEKANKSVYLRTFVLEKFEKI